ncbi:MAG: hypothetical protein ABIN55_05735 [Aeromicrobium sp.]
MMLSRSGWTLAALALASVCLIAPDAATTTNAATGPNFPQALLAIASLIQLTLASWVLVVIGLAQIGGTARVVRAITPVVLRRALFVGAAGALAMAPAQADRAVSPAQSPAQQHSLDGLRLPDRPVTATPEASSVVVVEPGDTLWAIAARSLKSDASDAEIAEACSRWYAGNRAVIGDDPDLIQPKQRLNPPKDRA